MTQTWKHWPHLHLRCWHRVGVTLTLSLAASVIALVPSAQHQLEFDRYAAAAGQWWRVMTGHFVHCNGEHLFWDLGVFLVLGGLCEWRGRRRYLRVLLAAGLVIPLAIWGFLPDLPRYRGLSGLDTALFTLLPVDLLRERWREGDRYFAAATILLLIGLAAKLSFEFATGSTLFVSASSPDYEPVPLAHLTGAAIGLAALCTPGTHSRQFGSA
jgi:rhomboid family GlyGly-CTERM serine protease